MILRCYLAVSHDRAAKIFEPKRNDRCARQDKRHAAHSGRGNRCRLREIKIAALSYKIT
jgi:hypothetical protein